MLHKIHLELEIKLCKLDTEANRLLGNGLAGSVNLPFLKNVGLYLPLFKQAFLPLLRKKDTSSFVEENTSA